MKIKTLAEILAESEADSASTPVSKQKTATQKYLSKKSAKRQQPVVKSKHPKSSPARSTSEDDETSQTVDHFDNDTSSFLLLNIHPNPLKPSLKSVRNASIRLLTSSQSLITYLLINHLNRKVSKRC